MKFDEDLIIERRKTRKIKVGNIFIGGDAPVAVQTMAKTKTDDTRATIEQIHAIQQAGADLVRVAVPDEKAARSLEWIRLNIQIPLVADIHFNAKFAMIALEQGVDKLRLNPGNIRNEAKIRDIVRCRRRAQRADSYRRQCGQPRPRHQRIIRQTPRALIESPSVNSPTSKKKNSAMSIISLKSQRRDRCVIAAYGLAPRSNWAIIPLHPALPKRASRAMVPVKSAVGMAFC
jgi:(E)-4-hydroxy-3-methylbut-2-enyl-diphosphate synthase